MKWIAPNYFEDFSCIAGACRHSCCAGWEIDVDPETLAAYQGVPGAFGERLRGSICTEGDAPHFRMTTDERCPFLQEDGLCELILQLGPDSLCQICADHPRFRNFFGDREEIGFGMCCEAAARLILSREEKVFLVLTDEDADDEPLSDEERDLLLIRQELIDAAQDRSRPVAERVQNMLSCAQLPDAGMEFPRWARFLLGLERLDEGWTALLTALRDAPSLPELRHGENWEAPFEQLLVYLLYRHLPAAMEDGDLAGRILYCALMWRLIRALCALQERESGALTLAGMAEICRMYSSEIEYSDENLAAILEEINA